MNFIRNVEEEAYFGTGSYKNYKYNGKELQETEMYDYGARFYMPDIGRWGVVDPMAEVTPHLSPYHYANNNPVMYNDPTGMLSQSFIDELWGSPSGTTWYNNGNGFTNNWGGMMDYDGGAQNYRSYSLAAQNDFITGGGYIDVEIPEVIMWGEGNGKTWNNADNLGINQYIMDSNISGALASWNYDVNSANMGQYIMNSKASMQTAAVERFLFIDIPLQFAGGALFSAGWKAANITRHISNGLSKLTTAEGFLGGSIGFNLPFNLKVGLYASENTLKYGTFKWSTIAPKFLTRNEWFGRNMLQITSEFQPTLGNWSSQIIPKGTRIQIGLVGQQSGNGLGTWLQFYTPGRVPFNP